MNRLWNPNKHDRSGISAGERKEKLHHMRPYLENVNCPYCDNPVLKIKEQSQYLTLGGSKHKCKRMPKDS
jgi:hypothetical protein